MLIHNRVLLVLGKPIFYTISSKYFMPVQMNFLTIPKEQIWRLFKCLVNMVKTPYLKNINFLGDAS